MGACDFQTSIRGKNMKEAYRRAVDRAVDDSGSDSYNGTISTTRGFRDVTSMYKASKLKLSDFINKHIDSCQKWGEAWGICVSEPIGNTLRVKSKVIHVPSKGTKKWVLKYVVYQNGEQIGSKDTKGDAIKLGREHTEKTGKDTTINMKKVLVNNDNCVAKIEYKSSSKEKEGDYTFFGMAAC